MSFATVVALIATYETIRARYPRFVRHSVRRRIGVYLSGTLLTSFVAGLATAPYAAFHFDRFVDYGLAANLVALPIMALWITPWAVAAFVLMIAGLNRILSGSNSGDQLDSGSPPVSICASGVRSF